MSRHRVPGSTRRQLLVAAALGPIEAWAQQRAAFADPLRLGVDRGLADAGLARVLVQAFGRDTGIPVRTSVAPSVQVLDALERGELDVSLTDVPDAEARLESLGLAHDRRSIATAEFVIVGPAPKGRQADPAGIAGGRDAAEALRRLRDAGIEGRARFLTANDGSGAHLLEQSLWRAAQIAPAAPWYAAVASGRLLAEARAQGAYALVESGLWSAAGGAPLAVLVERDAQLAVPVRVMRSFRSAHPAARLFTAWIVGPKGRRAAAVRGFR